MRIVRKGPELNGAGARTRTADLLITNPKVGCPPKSSLSVSIGNHEVRVRFVRARHPFPRVRASVGHQETLGA